MASSIYVCTLQAHNFTKPSPFHLLQPSCQPELETVNGLCTLAANGYEDTSAKAIWMLLRCRTEALQKQVNILLRGEQQSKYYAEALIELEFRVDKRVT